MSGTGHRNSGILVLNAGSSSLKFAWYDGGKELSRRLAGKFSQIALDEAELTVRVGDEKEQQRKLRLPNHAACMPALRDILGEHGFAVEAIGQRVVHGGPDFHEPQVVTPGMLDQLKKYAPMDLEHLPAALALIEIVGRAYPGAPQVACFDTAFHRDMPTVAKLLPLPRHYYEMGVQRYGFHGISYAYLMEELKKVAGDAAAKGRIILAHLGNGASMAAVRDGKGIDTTMGFTPAAGLVMSSRAGDIDPGLAMYFAQTEKMSAAQFNELVNQRSGLLGVSEISPDVRDLLQSRDPRATEALELFYYSAKKWIGAYAAALGGLDTLVFSGGIGENSAVVRARICDGLGFLGVEINEARNQANEAVISEEKSRVTVRMIRTDEELMIARYVRQLLQKGE